MKVGKKDSMRGKKGREGGRKEGGREGGRSGQYLSWSHRIQSPSRFP